MRGETHPTRTRNETDSRTERHRQMNRARPTDKQTDMEVFTRAYRRRSPEGELTEEFISFALRCFERGLEKDEEEAKKLSGGST